MDSGTRDQVALCQLAQALALLAVAVDSGPIETSKLPCSIEPFVLGFEKPR